MEDVGVKCPTGLVALAGVLNADPDRPADFGDRIRRDRARHCPAYDTAAIDLDHCGDERHRHARIATLDHRASADLSGVGEADVRHPAMLAAGRAGHTLTEQGRATIPATAADKMMVAMLADHDIRSEEHTSELQSLMRSSYAVFCLKKKKK